MRAQLSWTAQPEHSIDGRTVDVKRAVPKSEAPGPSRVTRLAEMNKIFVGGLAPSVTVAEFRTYFEGFGAVVDAVVMFDRQTQRSRGFGFVTFQDDAVVQNVLMGTHELNGECADHIQQTL
jgi:RNA-binding protein Musashi